jgi:beta-galactosidase
MPVWFGGDYNPDQWPESVWPEDVALMRRAHVNLATVGVFSWARIEPREGEFDFEWLDEVLNGLHAGAIRVDLATATASPPPWLTHTYPEVLPETKEGVRLWPGSRQHYCPSSPIYRRLAARLVQRLSERYANHPALEMWHVNNEYGCHVSHCYCDVSAAAFREWLERKYHSIGALNEAWATSFWSQRYSSFAEIYPPRSSPTFSNPTQLLDFDRFSSDELLECYLSELRILRAATPDVPVTTNFMGFFKDLDYWKWANEVDFVSDDSYPDPGDPRAHIRGAMAHDLSRSLKHGKSWLLMEQSSSAVNWRPRNAAKAPGQQRAWSYQCLARGADGVLFFQWRQSRAGAEKFHSGMVPHIGTNTRVWREIESLGAELAGLDRVIGGEVCSEVAIVLDWDSWWALEQRATPAQLSYVETLFAWYEALYRLGVSVDFVRPTDPLDRYKVVVVPTLLVVSGAAESNLASFVHDGGRLLVTYQSAILDENLHVTTGGYLGGLASLLGIRIEEFAPPASVSATDGSPASSLVSSEDFGTFAATEWAEFVHSEGARVVGRFTGGIVSDWPALTVNRAGDGSAWYVATMPGEAAREAILTTILGESGVFVARNPAVSGVEMVSRGGLLFAINHSGATVEIPVSGRDELTGVDGLSTVLAPFGVALLASPSES